MEQNELGTLQRQKFYREKVFDPEFSEHNGRIVKTTGDGFLAEFPSVIEAVSCSVDIQRQINQRETEQPPETRIAYRFGVNLGDIIHDGGDIYGDGVNVAARLEQIAEPGGICISGSAYDQLRTTIEAGYQDLGEVRVKNISRPIRAWRVLLDPAQTGAVVSLPTSIQETKNSLDGLAREHGSLANALDAVSEANRDQLEAIATRFEIEDAYCMPDRKIRAEIFKKAEDFRKYRRMIESIDQRAFGRDELKAKALSAAERLDFAAVEAVLSQVMTEEIEIAAETMELRAQNALMLGNVELAFTIFSAAADSFGAVDADAPARRRLQYEEILSDHGERFDGRGYEWAEKMCRAAINGLDGSDPMPLWRAHVGLGIAMAGQGHRARYPENKDLLVNAHEIYRHALTLVDAGSFPVQIATVHNNLGTVALKLARLDDTPETLALLDAATEMFGKALTAHTKDVFPFKWAMAQDNLGNALSLKGHHLNGLDGLRALEASKAAHAAALTVRTREAAPLLWAQTSENQGLTLKYMAENENCANPQAVYLEATRSFADALDVYDEDQTPFYFAKAHANFGTLLESEANQSSCDDPQGKFQAALAHFRTAITVYDELQAYGFRDQVVEMMNRITGFFEN